MGIKCSCGFTRNAFNSASIVVYLLCKSLALVSSNYNCLIWKPIVNIIIMTIKYFEITLSTIYSNILLKSQNSVKSCSLVVTAFLEATQKFDLYYQYE